MPSSKSRASISSSSNQPGSHQEEPKPEGPAMSKATRRAAVFGGVLLLGAIVYVRLGGDEGSEGSSSTPTHAAPATAAPSLASPNAAPEQIPTAAASAKPDREIAGASQILVAYKGAEIAPKEVTRSKADARARAEEALAKVRTDKDKFAEIAKEYSDDPSKVAGGAIGNFERYAMPKAFGDATFALEIGDISGVVESPRGFHIILRTK